MLLVLSPAKTLDYDSPLAVNEYTQPIFIQDSEKLVAKLRSYSPKQLAEMMELSDKLAALNVQRYQDFTTPFTPHNARQALFAFKGDVYEGLAAESLSAKEVAFAQQHVRILSGLYGLLKPLDLMQPYRLEMGRKLAMDKTRDLYGYWGGRIAEALNDELKAHKSKLLINLASSEYAAAIPKKALLFPMVDVSFKEKQGDKLKNIGLFAKKARGQMARFIVQNRLDSAESLKDFAVGGYGYAPKLSSASHYIFVRKAS